MAAQTDAISDDLDEVFSEFGSNSDDWETVDSDSDAVDRIQQLIDQTPPGHPEFAQYQHLLGQVLVQRYLNSGDVEDLQAGLEHGQQAVDLTPKGHPARPGFLRGLAVSLTEQYWRLGDLGDLEAAVKSTQEAVNLVPADHPDRAEYLHILAATLLIRYQRLGELDDLGNAVEKFQQAVDITPAVHPERAKYLLNLGAAFTEKYQRLGAIEDLTVAMHNVQQSVDLTSADNPHRARHLQHLAVCYTNRYKKIGDLDDLETALKWDQQALDLTPEDHPERADYLQNVASSFTERYQRLGDLKDLEAALQHNQEAVDLIPEDHPDRVIYLQSLGISLKDRYQQFGELRDLEAALQQDQEVVDLTPTDHHDQAARLQRLAVSFTERYKRLGNLKDLEAALQNDQKAVDLTPEDHPERAKRLQSLGISFKDRYCMLGDIKDLEAAQKHDKEAVDLTLGDSTERAARLENLATSFRLRYERLGDLKDLEASFQNDQEALNLTPLAHPNRATYLHSSGLSFIERYQRLGNQKDLENAVQKFQEAIALTPDNHTDRAIYLRAFMNSLTVRYHALRNLDDLETALQRGQEIMKITPTDHLDLSGYMQDLAALFMNQYVQTENPEDLQEVHRLYMNSFRLSAKTPEPSWHAALDWALFAQEHEPKYAPKAYATAFGLLPEILWIGHAIPTWRDTVHRLDVGQVTSTAVRTCIKLNNLTSAVEIIEQGLATTFQQMLQLKPDVGKLSIKHAERFQKLSSDLYGGTARDLGDIAIERKYLLDDIHKEPGLENFLLSKPYSALSEAAQNGPMVILNSHEESCDGVIILNPTSEPVHVLLPNITLKQLQSQRDMLKEYLGRSSLRTREESVSSRLFAQREGFKYKSSKEFFEGMLAWLWINVVDPVYQHGIYKGRIWWLPTGAFTGLPLHASPPIDQFIHSYTATLGSLLEAQNKKSSSALKVGVVGVTHTGLGKRNHLQGVEKEVNKICSIIQGPTLKCLQGEQATTEAVKHELEDCSWLHLACHGTQDLLEPTKSCLLLYEGSLELETILRMPLSNAEFVFLSACQTAMGDAELVNESFHLGGGFIAAGFRSAIGTMWTMEDQDGPLVAEIFYGHLFQNGRQPQVNDVAEALHLAVKELRVRNVPYERWIPFVHMGV